MEMYKDPQFEYHLGIAEERYGDNREAVLGVCLMQPNEPMNSSSRKLMYAIQSTHRLDLLYCEKPYLGTGYENLFGHKSSSYIVAGKDVLAGEESTVLFRFEKFSDRPGHHFFLVTINDNNELDIIEKVDYHHNTETYGYLYKNERLAGLGVGSRIHKGEVLRTSSSFDEYGNHMDGVNLNCCYMALSKNTEDPVIISRSASRKLTAPMIHKIEILINDNDIPLNLYGDDTTYKIFPDIGELTSNHNRIASIRKENKEESFFTQDISRLREPMISDITYQLTHTGKVIDINVYSNKQMDDEDEDGMYTCYEGQIRKYIEDDRRFCREVVSALGMYIDNSDYKKSYELSRLYTICEKKLRGCQFIRDKSVFSNLFVEIYILEERPAEQGDKISNRFGGKGVISEIRDDDKMPRIEDSDVFADLIWNQATTFNRQNLGQLSEATTNYISRNILDSLQTGIFDLDGIIERLYNYFKMFSEEYANYFMEYVNNYLHQPGIGNFGGFDDEEAMARELMGNFISEAGDNLHIVTKPITECIDLNKIKALYKEYSWIKPKTFSVPIKGSDGRIRFVKSNKPSIISHQYVYRMKQFAEEKHSANSLSATNVRSENSKSRASKMYMASHAMTPVRFGEMESNIFDHVGPEIYVVNLMLHSTSPQGRRDAEQLLTGDPHTINVQLSDDARSRSVEKVNATLKTMGLRLVFEKEYIVREPLTFRIVEHDYSPYTRIVDHDYSPYTRIVEHNHSPYTKIVDHDYSPYTKIVDNDYSPYEKVDP